VNKIRGAEIIAADRANAGHVMALRPRWWAPASRGISLTAPPPCHTTKIQDAKTGATQRTGQGNRPRQIVDQPTARRRPARPASAIADKVAAQRRRTAAGVAERPSVANPITAG